jgi:cobyrinic acid a,c-diamide synthase
LLVGESIVSRVLISAAHKSSGKTTISIGLCAALHRRGYRVQPFKKGPDYIDPLWLTKASHKPCYNLDFNTQSHSEITSLWKRCQADADIRFIEGNKGLYDGVDPMGSDCNAALARLLDVPVILVVDTQGITRGVAPLVLGYQQFDPNIQLAGIILNKVAGERHERKLRAAINEYTDLEVFGAVRRHDDLFIDERHLGLVPSNEHEFANNKIDVLCEHIDRQIDMDVLVDRLGLQRGDHGSNNHRHALKPGLRIGIAQDSAFGFYYQDDINAFQQAGAELVPVDLIHDAVLPEIDGLFIGGGFPETHMQALSENRSMRDSVKQAVENNLPVYAECGGLMYLCRKIAWQGEDAHMVGALPADVVMHERPQGRGYVKLKETQHNLWGVAADRTIPAHEFHHSSLVEIGDNVEFAYDVIRGKGITDGKDGMVYRNTLASYAHLRDSHSKHWVTEFVQFIKSSKEV